MPEEQLTHILFHRVRFPTPIRTIDRLLPAPDPTGYWISGADSRIGLTFSLWRTDADMPAAAYDPGKHRIQLNRYRAEHTADRSSFTRARLLRCSGRWNGEPELEAAAPAGVAPRELPLAGDHS